MNSYYMYEDVKKRPTVDTMAAVDAATARASAGKMVNASTSANAEADINFERLRWLSKPASTSEGGGGVSHGGHVNSMVTSGYLNSMVNGGKDRCLC